MPFRSRQGTLPLAGTAPSRPAPVRGCVPSRAACPYRGCGALPMLSSSGAVGLTTMSCTVTGSSAA